MSVMREVLRLVGQVLSFAWHGRRPLLPLLVLCLGLAGMLALVVGLAAPIAIYPLL